MTRSFRLARIGLFIALVTATMLLRGATAPDGAGEAKAKATLTEQWQTEGVDDALNAGRFTSLAVDVEDHPHIGYIGAGLRYARYDGSAWHIEVVDPRPTAGAGTSLALDRAGWPHISYFYEYSAGQAYLQYTHFDGSNWHTDVIEEVVGGLMHTSLALDSGDRPHIAYSSSLAVKYASYDGSTWISETVDTVGGYEAISLALDSADHPHLSYYDGTDRDLKYAHIDGSSWYSETVDSNGDVGRYSSLALSPDDQPRISYYGGFYLQYAWHDGSTWYTETVDSGAGAGWFTSLAIDPAGLPRIGYYDSSAYDLKYAWHDGSSWYTETVDSEGDVGSFASLGLDAAGWPHIGYRDATGSRLMYAHHDRTPPDITLSPFAEPAGPHAVRVHWETDEESDSLVRYGRRAGVFDLKVQDSSLGFDHTLDLTGLEPSAVYHYVVHSTDASGNTVTSGEGFFETAPLPDDEPPTVFDPDLARAEGRFDYYGLTAPASDNIGVERVEFLMDGELVGTSYSARDDGKYAFYLSPATMGLPREEFFSEHSFEAVARDAIGLSHTKSQSHIPQAEPLNGQLRIVSPGNDHTIYAPGGVVPPGYEMSIQVYASEYEWKCWLAPLLPVSTSQASISAAGQGYLPAAQLPDSYRAPWCHEVEGAVDSVDFLIDGTLVATSTYSTEFYMHYFWWYPAGEGPGTHQFEVRSHLSDGTQATRTRTVEIVEGDPGIDVSRQIVRVGNTFVVSLWILNQGTTTVGIDWIEDNLTGFQAIGEASVEIPGTTASYSVHPDYRTDDKRCDVKIWFQEDSDDHLSLGPGEDVVVEYTAVPILYPAWSGQYAAGEQAITVRYWEWGRVTLDLDRLDTTTADSSLLSTGVMEARAASDYLIVTNPERLFTDNYQQHAVNDLLSAMAELAQLKAGILGYIDNSGSPGGSDDPAYIRQLLDDWGAGMRGSDGVIGHHSRNGYVLLVGESEIIPAKELSKDYWTVHLSDLWYADTNNDWPNPERVVGRIVGDDANSLTIPIQSSIRVHNGEPGYTFDRERALVIAGRGDGYDKFENNAEDVAEKLRDEFSSVVLLKQREQETAGHIMRNIFRTFAPERDVIFYRDHAGATSWSDGSVVVQTSDLIGTNPIDFGDRKPFVFGCACSSGNYEHTIAGYEYASLAEAFLQDGAVIYIGATQPSDRRWNNKACKRYFEYWVGRPYSIGQCLRDTKRDITGGDYWSDYQGDRWAAMYNLYGDPKYGAASGSREAIAVLHTTSAEPPSTLNVEIPDYEVQTLAGEDYVEIPGGNTLFELGKPLVPIYIIETDIPEGYRVQGVTLTNRSGLTATTGLSLPIATLEWDSVGARSAAADAEAGWWPDEIFDWEVRENPDYSSTLLIRMAPFYYNPATTDAKFYKNYDFDIDTISTTVGIELLATDREVYTQSETVRVDLWLNNTGEAQDVIVDAVIRPGNTQKVVDGLLLRSLNNLQGLATYSAEWDSTGFEAGDYTIEAQIRSADGTVLDRELEEFTLGVSRGEITALTASPTTFDAGTPVSISLDFENTGTVPISGTARIKVQDGTGQVVKEFGHEVVGLTPTESMGFEDVWDTSGVRGGPYHIIGNVSYHSKTTEPRVVDVSANARVFLPVVLRNATGSLLLP